MFKKLLIANRGEIACRITRTARRMGLPTVAVYSEADKNSLHVTAADEAVCIGPPPAAQSYLSIERLVEACCKTGADAVHPGYGFLAENAAFAERLQDCDITFVGPSPHAIRSMGDKVTARRLAQQAGIPTVPGHPDAVHSAEQAVAVAIQLGFPVMLKASAGGGGKGMRLVRNEEECRDEFGLAANEAQSSFGDSRLLVEKYIEQPRHIEFQIIADRFGNTIQLGERECSIQRRHQKVVEEAPSPILDPATRTAIGEQAAAIAKAVGYESAGTVEFLLDADRNVYFLEMNTRLQVEHPVTEYVTGLDLVELMIRVASGEPLPIQQEQVTFSGWAFEARVYAEDPARGFLPSVGRLTNFRPPPVTDGVRLDSGCAEGSEVSLHYDPLLAKLVVHGPSRDDAITRMQQALDAFCIRGVGHNLEFLSAIFRHPSFQNGNLSTEFIPAYFGSGYDPRDHSPANLEHAVVAASAIHHRCCERAMRIEGQLTGFVAVTSGDWVVLACGGAYPVSVEPIVGGHRIGLSGQTYEILSNWRFGDPVFRARIDTVDICAKIERWKFGYRVSFQGTELDINVLSPQAAEFMTWMPKKTPPAAARQIAAPMPGLLVQLAVSKSELVRCGQIVAVIEAMKMENSLRSHRDGRVARTLAVEGDVLSVDQPILEFE